MTVYASIIGIGGYLPDNIVTNDELIAQYNIQSDDEWIRGRTGITQRHIAPEGVLASDLALPAAEQALQRAGITAQDLDLIVFATTTPDRIYPSTACLLQAKLKAGTCPAFDIQAVCSGFLYALTVAESFIVAQKYKTILVVGGEVYSHILDWQDRGTCVLFGDGAGAAVVTASAKPGIENIKIHADGNYADKLTVPAHLAHGKLHGTPFTRMNGAAIYRFAIDGMSKTVVDILGGQVPDWLVLHQANERIIDSVAEQIKIDPNKVVKTVTQQGNTSAASIPLALSHYQDKFKKGDRVVLAAVGGGITWGAASVIW